MKYHPECSADLTVRRETGDGTMSGGQFDWGGRLPKSNGGARRYPQAEWKPAVECKSIRVLDCETVHVEQIRKKVLVTRWFRMEGPSLNG